MIWEKTITLLEELINQKIYFHFISLQFSILIIEYKT